MNEQWISGHFKDGDSVRERGSDSFPKRYPATLPHGDQRDSEPVENRLFWDTQFPEYEISPVFFKKRDRHPDSTACVPIRPFEAADLIAYENYRANISAEDGNVYLDQLRGSFLRMEDLPGAQGWGFARGAELEEICRLWRVPIRAS